MITTLVHLLRLFPFLCGGHRQLALENLALRQQLAVYKRTAKRPKLRCGERLFWVCLSRAWTRWRAAHVIVEADLLLPRSNYLVHNGSSLARTVLLKRPDMLHANTHRGHRVGCVLNAATTG
jgi:hypothetical protein